MHKKMASILIIDDDAAVRGLFQTVLEGAGHAVSLAGTVTDGYTLLRSSAIGHHRSQYAGWQIGCGSGAGTMVRDVRQHHAVSC